MKTVGQSMRDARQRCGLTIKELAGLARIPVSSVSNYELDITMPGLLNLITLADVLGVALDDYIGRRPPGVKR